MPLHFSAKLPKSKLVRTKLSLFLIALSVMGASPVPTDNSATILQEEYKKLGSEQSKTSSSLCSRLQELVNARSKAITESRKRAEMELAGPDLVKKCSVVVASCAKQFHLRKVSGLNWWA
jgi:hypothetical protein